MILCVISFFRWEAHWELISFLKETQPRQHIVRNYKVLMKHKRHGIQSNGIFTIRRISENSFKFSKRDNVSEQQGWMFHGQGAKYINESIRYELLRFEINPILMIYWDAALEFNWHWPHSDFWSGKDWQDTKNYLRNRQQTNKNLLKLDWKPAKQ